VNGDEDLAQAKVRDVTEGCD